MTTADAFVVVVNKQGQHGLWQARRDVPPGWRTVSAALTTSDCLAEIERRWPDLTPASISTGAAGAGGGGLVHELFAERAARGPEALAVVAGRSRVTYGELDRSASRLARHLAEAGAGPEALVGVCLERGVDLIRAMLAIMKAGAGYLPLDPSLPPGRLAAICAQLRPVAVLTAEAGSRSAWPTRLIPLGELADELAGLPADAPAVSPHPDNVCYVIHTSGSTGVPKAVAVSYGSLAATIAGVTAAYEIGTEDRVAQLASLAFDTSLEQVFATLTRGAALILPPPGIRAPSQVLRGIERHLVTVLDLTPAYWHQILALARPGDQRLRSVRLMITGGEMADPGDCRTALRAAPQARLLNAYGLTETAITSTLYDVGAGLAAPAGIVPAGKPVGGARIMILDESLSPVPAGTAGEVCIGGPQVARGYLGHPALTAERFVPDPGGEPGARMFRTGDRGRWLDDGSLEVGGRLDRQLKVRGFRVEPAEIESALAGHPGIGQVLVSPSARNGAGTRLVAYYTPARAADGNQARRPQAASLRSYLLDRLPEYMVPSAFVPRQQLPAGTEQVPEPVPAPVSGERPARPGPDERQTPTQAGLAALWARLLGVGQVGLDDDFFALGGDSLTVAEMLAAAESIFGLPPDSMRMLTRIALREPTLRAFAAAVREARAGRLGTGTGQPDADFSAEIRLDLAVGAGGAPYRPLPNWQAPREVLLTGATGFLGSHLLRELLDETGARIWCLVRARDTAAARARIDAAAARYDLAPPADDRVLPLPGDLAEPGLGLPDAVFDRLARDIDVLYHVGAQVNFIYPYQALRAANVTGTREVIRLAAAYRGIPVHYVSTTAVLAGLGVAGIRQVTEETPLAHPERLRMGYIETKYVAEELLRGASRAGLPVAIYRPLDVVGSVRTGAWSTSTEICAVIRFITDTGLAPAIDLPLDFVPADVCAAAIRYISVSEQAAGRSYHLASPGHAPLGSVLERLRDVGYPITEIPLGDWVRELARHAARDPSHPMAAFLPLFTDRDTGSGLTVAEMYLEHVFPSYGRSNTERALLGSGITFPPVSGELLDRNIDRLMRSGYLAAPPVRRVPSDAG